MLRAGLERLAERRADAPEACEATAAVFARVPASARVRGGPRWRVKRAAGEEAKTLRSVNLRNEMNAALKEKVAEKEAKVKAEKAAPPEFPKAVIDKMDAATVRKLLEERGLPTSGKIDRLRERLGAVKRK